MFLYHYMEPQYVLGTILTNLLKLSTMDSLNDPYEMLPERVYSNGSHAPICLVREQMREMLKNTGMICMSEAATCPAMWAHYADKHRGVALEFEFTDAQMTALFKVDYLNERVVIGPNDDTNDKDIRKGIFERMIKTKATCWGYEEEFRWVFSLQDKGVLMDDRGLFYRHMPEEWRGVILGVDCELSEGVVRKALDSMGFTDVAVVRARLSDTCFEIVADHPKVD